jgi:hypothetical protein
VRAARLDQRLTSLAGPKCTMKQRAAVPGQVNVFVRRFLAGKVILEKF